MSGPTVPMMPAYIEGPMRRLAGLNPSTRRGPLVFVVTPERARSILAEVDALRAALAAAAPTEER